MLRLGISSLALVLATAILLGCSGSTGPSGADYHPALPSAWAASISNPYFPLVPGTVVTYRTSDGVETERVEVLAETREIQGVQATIVHDQVSVNGELAEDTFDWYDQGDDGTVWYLGEDSKEIDHGTVVSTEGSWEWGVNGALPGVVMWADPGSHLNEQYRQEYYQGVAEDLASVVAVNQAVQVPFGDLSSCIETRDWSALESGSVEYKYYCPGVGLVLETDQAGGHRNELTGVTEP